MYERFIMHNENKLRQENLRSLDRAADIIMGTKETVRTGFDAFDHWEGGFGRGELVLLGARPAVGKTAMALMIAEYNAIRFHVPVFYISLQKSSCFFMKRLISLMTGIDTHYDLISDEANELFQTAYTKIREAPFYVRHYDNPTVTQIQNEMGFCSEMPQLVVVDEIGKPHMSNRESMRIMKELRKLAEATDATVLILSNVSRLVDERPNHMPTLYDFPVPRDMADAVIMMCRDGYYNPECIDDEYDLAHLRFYDCNGYDKMEFDLNYIVDAKRFERGTVPPA